MNHPPRFPIAVAGYFCILPILFCCLFAGCITSDTGEEEPEKPAVEVDVSTLDFGKELDTLTFTVTLTGSDREWKLGGEIPSWCETQIERTKTGARVTVRIDRGRLSPGEHTASLTVKWNTGDHPIDIRVVVPEKSAESGTIIIDTPLPEKEEFLR